MLDNYSYTFVTIIELTWKCTASILHVRAFHSCTTLHVHVNSTKSKIHLFFTLNTSNLPE